MDGERGNNEPGMVVRGGFRDAFSWGAGKDGLRNSGWKFILGWVLRRGMVDPTHQTHSAYEGRQDRRSGAIVRSWSVSFHAHPSWVAFCASGVGGWGGPHHWHASIPSWHV